MIDLARLRSVRIVVTHDNCPDGMASAILVADALRPYGAEFVFAQYGTQKYLELPAKTGMLFVDIAPPEHRASQFLRRARKPRHCASGRGANGPGIRSVSITRACNR